MDLIYREIILVKAWFFTTVVILGLSYLSSIDPESAAKFDALSYIYGIVLTSACFVSLRYFSGTERQSKKSPYNLTPITTWGYFLTFTVSGIIILVIRMIIPLPVEVLGFIIITILFSLFSFLAYCPDKKEKFSEIKSVFRGY